MSYKLQTYEELLTGINNIKTGNTSALNEGANIYELLHEPLKGTDIEYFIPLFDGSRAFFRRLESFLDEIDLVLKSKSITLGLVNRINEFGEEAFESWLSMRNAVDKGDLNSNNDFRVLLNSWYVVVSDNYNSISELSGIADALAQNFRDIKPLADVPNNNIRIRDKSGLTVTADNEIYINDTRVEIMGQRKLILLLLIESYVTSKHNAVSWMKIEEEIRKGSKISREKVIDRVSALRTRLKELRIDEKVIEISNVEEGVDTSWRLVKH